MIAILLSCKKTTTNNSIISDGIYRGTFQRQVSGSGQISNVIITFSSGNWSGQSQFPKYPALCNGTYKIDGAEDITFENACPWTAEFDWSFILSHKYKIKVADKNIEISRDYNGVFKDIYRLTKQ